MKRKFTVQPSAVKASQAVNAAHIDLGFVNPEDEDIERTAPQYGLKVEVLGLGEGMSVHPTEMGFRFHGSESAIRSYLDDMWGDANLVLDTRGTVIVPDHVDNAPNLKTVISHEITVELVRLVQKVLDTCGDTREAEDLLFTEEGTQFKDTVVQGIFDLVNSEV